MINHAATLAGNARNCIKSPTIGHVSRRLLRGKKESAGCENPALPQIRVDRLGVIQRAALPAREVRPVCIDVVACAVVEAGVEKLTAATAGLAALVALFAAFSALLISGFRTRFFVRHNITFRVVGCSSPPPYSILRQHLCYLFAATSFAARRRLMSY